MGAQRAADAAGRVALSERELAVAELVARGAGNRQVAAELHLSEKTVERHLSHVYAKLGIDERAASWQPLLTARRLSGGSRRRGRAGYQAWPTKTGSGTSATPKACSTPAAISRASATSSAVLAPPRLVSASVCLEEIATAPRARPAREAGVLDQPGGRGLDAPVGLRGRPAAGRSNDAAAAASRS